MADAKVYKLGTLTLADVARELEVKSTGMTVFASPSVLVSELSIAGK